MAEEASPLNDCWNKIGVWGNSECPELEKYIHCRNCPVYSTAAAQMLNGEASPDYVREWTELVARPREARKGVVHSAVIFSIESEWFALSTRVFKEVAEAKTIHSLPHRRDGFVLGIVNIRGELLICVSLAQALGLKKTGEAVREKKRDAHRRFLVVSAEGGRLVFPVDEVGGIEPFDPKELKEVPATLTASSATAHVNGVLSWRDKSVGHLDAQLLFYTLNKGLA